MNKPTHPIDDDHLIDLVNRLLPPEQERTVMGHLRECASCEARFQVAVRERELSKTTPAPSIRDGAVVPATARGRVRVRAVALATVAAVVALALAWLGTRRAGPEAYWMPVELERTTLRSLATEVDGRLGEAIESYQDRDARRTIKILHEAPVPQDEMLASVQRLLLASAMVNVGNHRAAIEILDALDVPTLPVPWRQRGLWIRCLALRGAGRMSELRVVLSELAMDPGDLGEMARRELGRPEEN